MPVKIRCRGCEKILNVPDKARGRVIKCPQCETKLKVPGGEGKVSPKRDQPAAGQQKRKKVKAAAKPPGSDSDFFANLDLGQADHHEDRVCPFCAADLSDETDVCPECGMNTATRQMDAKVAKQRSRQGPPASAFYKEAWGDSFRFIKENKSLALRTGWYWELFGILFGGCFYMAAVYCSKGPPITFWSFLTLICALGIPGWYWFLSEKVIQGTLIRQEKFDRIHFDFFQSVTLGSRAFFWPAIVMLPFLPLLGLVLVRTALEVNSVSEYPFVEVEVTNPQQLGVIVGLFLVFPLLSFPLAMVHQTAKYTYKAWVFWEMFLVMIRNIGPSLYWGVMAIVTFILPFGGLVAGLGFMFAGAESPEDVGLLKMNQQFVGWVFGLIGESTQSTMHSIALGLVHFVVACALVTPVFFAMGFSAVFLIRANGLLGHTFQKELALVQSMGSNIPTTFWVRTLAFLVDAPLTTMTCFLVTANKKAMMAAFFANGVLAAGYFLWKMPLLYLLAPWALVQTYVYYVVSEQTTARTTIGKDGFGLIVSKENHGQMTFKDATIRYFCGLANLATLGVGFVMCAFHPQKKALNDILSKTEVVWRGDR